MRLRLTGDPAEFAAMQLRLAAVNIADVHPPRLEYLLFATHPDTVERLAAAREAGQPLTRRLRGRVGARVPSRI